LLRYDRSRSASLAYFAAVAAVVANWSLFGAKAAIFAGVRGRLNHVARGCDGSEAAEERQEIGQLVLLTGLLMLGGAVYFCVTKPPWRELDAQALRI
tara:strand:- start:184 stop:474 length:291 start_codon:yes stop_codon:yes gene_type:complete